MADVDCNHRAYSCAPVSSEIKSNKNWRKQMKKIDYNALDRAGWENAGLSLAAAPTKTWINIGQWLNAGDRFFTGDKGVDEKTLISNAGAVIKTLDERSLRRYRETERNTRDARSKMADNGCPLDRQFIFFHHVKDLPVDDQVMFIVEKRAWTNHTEFRDAVEIFSESIAENPFADHNTAFNEAYDKVEEARKARAAAPRSKPDKNKIKVMLRLPKETHDVIEWYYATEKKTVADALTDAAYELAQEHESEYQDEKRRAKAADEHAAVIQKLTKQVADGEAALGKLLADVTNHQAQITFLKDRPPGGTDASGYEFNVDDAIWSHNANITRIKKQIEKTEAALATVRDKLTAAQAPTESVSVTVPEAECQPSA